MSDEFSNKEKQSILNGNSLEKSILAKGHFAQKWEENLPLPDCTKTGGKSVPARLWISKSIKSVGLVDPTRLGHQRVITCWTNGLT